MNEQSSETPMGDTPDESEETTVSIESLQEIEKLRQEAKDYKEKYLRSLADLENARKRLQKEKQDLMRYAIEQVVCDLLQPLDNFENALRFSGQGSDEVKNWATGFHMILSQFNDALTGHGVSTFTTEGQAFDPHHHEAVEMIESDVHPEGTVVEEFIKGYKLGEKTIRPARVKVSKRKGNQAKSDEHFSQDAHENKAKHK